MDVKKTIQINPNFFTLGKKTKKREKKPRADLRNSIKPNDIKKKLLAKIKQHQQQKLVDDKEEREKEKKEADKFSNDFNKQLDYLEKIISNKKQKKRRRRQTKRARQSAPNTTLNTHKDPPYGCLKNGTKPTFSQYKKTLKNREKITFADPKPKILITPPEIKARQDKLNKLKSKLATPKSQSSIKKLVTVKKTIKIYKLGKDKKSASVGVLIKSGRTRKKVRNEQDVLRKKCLSEIKQYLRKHNLIKAGSSAPEDVLRKLYEDSFLAGNIYNKNPDNLLHNYLSDEPFD